MENKESSKLRSLKQNKYYWGVIVAEALEFYKKNEGAFLLDILDAVKADATPEFVHELFKMRFNKGKTTTKNKTDEMEAYMLELRVFFLQKHGLDLPPPNEPLLEELTIGKDYAN